MRSTHASTHPRQTAAPASKLTVAGLFSGLGGLEVGLSKAGFRPVLVCDPWTPAREVLAAKLTHVPSRQDVRRLRRLPDATLLTAGFPCNDLSLAGVAAGIDGARSGLVREVFRLLENSDPEWVLLENVPHMLTLQRGAAMRVITEGLERLGFAWAYRVVDTRFTGLPQRRPRVLVLASRRHAPEGVLLSQDVGELTTPPPTTRAYGFYWTEGRRGLGWINNAIPPLKGGSTVGIPSAPAVWLPDAEPGQRIVTLTLPAAEALQGLPPGWTDAAAKPRRADDHRWKLIGNAVTTRVAQWIGERIATTQHDGIPVHDEPAARPLDRHVKWPNAGWGSAGHAYTSTASPAPVLHPYTHLADVLTQHGSEPLSLRATLGFRSRLKSSDLPHPSEFMADLDRHITHRQSTQEAAAG